MRLAGWYVIIEYLKVQENQHVTQAIAGRGATYRTVGAAATRSYARVMTRREEKAGEIVADLN